MAKELFVPQLGQTVEQVTIINWLVEDGSTVKRGQEVVEVETDKAVFPVEANANGTIHIGPFPKGMVVPVLAVIAVIGTPEDTFQAGQPASQASPKEHAARETTPAKAEEKSAEVQQAAPEKIFASPRAKRIASEKQISLEGITATGGGGVRITEQDVLDALKNEPKVTAVAQRMAQEVGVDIRGLTGSGVRGMVMKADVEQAIQTKQFITQPVISSEVTRLPLTGVRKIICERMASSVHTSARVTLFMEVDATELVTWREKLKALYAETWGFNPGYNELLAKIVATALRKYPYMNARLTIEAIELVPEINIGIAVDTERGLLVPVVRNVDQKGLQQLGAEIRELAAKARNGRSLPDELAGGTFTITNLGMYDVDGFTPVINLPEAAILGVGRISAQPVYVGDVLVKRQMMVLSLVFDHRIVDGAPAARFLQFVKDLIETPALLAV
ncbi:MAG: dihydrolipoamide acetyltransferase family protein [Anaerolineaceae bacterium]